MPTKRQSLTTKLSVTHRRQENAQNSFVRLHPSTARSLWKQQQQAATIAAAASPPRGVDRGTVWCMAQETGRSVQNSSGIEFLPLAICGVIDNEDANSDREQSQVMYVSYNGGDVMEGR